LPPLSLSILGVEPFDEFIGEVADFVHHSILTRPADLQGEIEVEAKIGVLRDRGGNRLNLPVLVETILAPKATDCHFESNMSQAQHQHFNILLNKLKEASDKPGYHSSSIAYTHAHLVDTFYASENSREKIRVTRNDKTGEVIATVKKVRLGNLDVYSPKQAADWRISVNVEVPVQHPLGTPTHSRRKDRISYSHEEFVVDLTQVASYSATGSQPELLHELEVEFANSRLLTSAAAKRNLEGSPEHERSAFDELIRAFVNNARILARNANGGWQ
jgi:hypothetical protein